MKSQETPLVKKNASVEQADFSRYCRADSLLNFLYRIPVWSRTKRVVFSSVIALIVAMVPEGLPAVLTMILSPGVKEMADQQAIIKTMPSVETAWCNDSHLFGQNRNVDKNEMTVVRYSSL